MVPPLANSPDVGRVQRNDRPEIGAAPGLLLRPLSTAISRAKNPPAPPGKPPGPRIGKGHRVHTLTGDRRHPPPAQSSIVSPEDVHARRLPHVPLRQQPTALAVDGHQLPRVVTLDRERIDLPGRPPRRWS